MYRVRLAMHKFYRGQTCNFLGYAILSIWTIMSFLPSLCYCEVGISICNCCWVTYSLYKECFWSVYWVMLLLENIAQTESLSFLKYLLKNSSCWTVQCIWGAEERQRQNLPSEVVLTVKNTAHYFFSVPFVVWFFFWSV